MRVAAGLVPGSVLKWKSPKAKYLPPGTLAKCQAARMGAALRKRAVLGTPDTDHNMQLRRNHSPA